MNNRAIAEVQASLPWTFTFSGTVLDLWAYGTDHLQARIDAWLRQLFVFFASKRHIASELLKHTDNTNPVFGGGRARVIAAGQPLLAAAQHTHEVRNDLAIEQILDLIHAIATIRGDTSYTQPILQVALDGLHP
jgi:hypothetical protein